MAVTDWMRFQLAYGFGSVMAAKALEKWHSPTLLFHTEDWRLRQHGMKEDELRRVQKAKDADLGKILAFCERNRVRILTPDDDLYPMRLRNIYSPPAVLYAAGNWIDLDDILCIAVVGTRRCTQYGSRTARQISADLAARGVVTVSGLAAGIDSCCHDATVEAGGRTIAVQGCGIDVTYPVANRELKKKILQSGGAVITEFPPGMEPQAYHFPIRNRIIAGLSHGTLVVEGERRSGSLITAGCALTEGRDVFAVPGNVDANMSDAPNWLIREGATMVRDAGDILDEYNLRDYDAAHPGGEAEAEQLSLCEKQPGKPKKKAAPAKPYPQRNDDVMVEMLNQNQRTVLNTLNSEPMTADEVVTATGLSVPEVLSVLTQLEIFGIIKIHAGHRFSR